MDRKKTKRIAFLFDEQSYAILEQMTKDGPFMSLADTVRDSLQICNALQSQARQGFTEIVARNPETGDERVIIIPSLRINKDE